MILLSVERRSDGVAQSRSDVCLHDDVLTDPSRRHPPALATMQSTRSGKQDTVANNVGGTMPALLIDTSAQDLRGEFTFNVSTARALTAAAVPLMLEHSGGGSIINITSILWVFVRLPFSPRVQFPGAVGDVLDRGLPARRRLLSGCMLGRLGIHGRCSGHGRGGGGPARRGAGATCYRVAASSSPAPAHQRRPVPGGTRSRTTSCPVSRSQSPPRDRGTRRACRRTRLPAAWLTLRCPRSRPAPALDGILRQSPARFGQVRARLVDDASAPATGST